MNKLRVLNTIAFVVFCFAIGEVTAILLTSLIFNLNAAQIFEILRQSINSGRSIILTWLSFSTLFRFLVIPALYLLLYNRSSLNFLWIKKEIRFTPLLLIIILIFSFTPFISLLIEFNYTIELPVWLSEIERYFEISQERAEQLTSLLFTFTEFKDLIIVIFIMSIIPGVVEEFFFRGLVQTQLQNILKNHHYAIFLSAFLFSFFHFQFYGFIPRMVLGLLLGYLYGWSKNIWYPSAAHVLINLISVLGVYFFGTQIMNPENVGFTVILVAPSAVISVLIILYLKKILVKNSGR